MAIWSWSGSRPTKSEKIYTFFRVAVSLWFKGESWFLKTSVPYLTCLFMRKKCQKGHFYKCQNMFCFKIKEQFLHLDPDLDPAAQINADPCVSGNGFGPATLLFISVAEGIWCFFGDRDPGWKKIQIQNPGWTSWNLFLKTIKIFGIKNT
jgi:hypothetical protein